LYVLNKKQKKGENILNIQLIIDGLRKDGVRNFFFYYLEGICFFAAKEYRDALGQFIGFSEICPYLFHGAPVKTIDKLLASLTITKNLYQVALV